MDQYPCAGSHHSKRLLHQGFLIGYWECKLTVRKVSISVNLIQVFSGLTSANEVSRVPPLDVVAGSFAHGILSIAAAIAPPREEIAIVIAFLVLGGLAGDQSAIHISFMERIEGGAQRAPGSRQGESEIIEGHHICDASGKSRRALMVRSYLVGWGLYVFSAIRNEPEWQSTSLLIKGHMYMDDRDHKNISACSPGTSILVQTP